MYPQGQYPQAPSQPGMPQQYGQVSNSPGVVPPEPEEKGGRKMLFIVIGSALLVLIIIVVAVVLAGGSKTKKATTNAPTTQQSTGPAPATALTLQQNYDAINQNLGSLNDFKDFPPSALSDTSLGN